MCDDDLIRAQKHTNSKLLVFLLALSKKDCYSGFSIGPHLSKLFFTKVVHDEPLSILPTSVTVVCIHVGFWGWSLRHKSTVVTSFSMQQSNAGQWLLWGAFLRWETVSHFYIFRLFWVMRYKFFCAWSKKSWNMFKYSLV